MKDKILLFIIGVLVGALISTGGFLIYTNVTKSDTCTNQPMQMRDKDGFGRMGNNGERPEMPNGERPNMNENDSNRPQRPDDMNERTDMQGMTPPDNSLIDSNSFVGFESANKVFTISGISNLFSGIVIYSVE